MTARLGVLRVRNRGPAREIALVEVRAPTNRAARAVIRAVARARIGDYMLATRGTPGTSRFLPVPRQGPILTTRALAHDAPSLSELHLRLGDIELF